MTTNVPDATLWSAERMEERVVRYGALRPCYNAFIDTRTPGSEEKENFTIIGPGVSENPEQHVHIAEPHGFNIGGARQPPNCVNSQHSHETAEVFVVHSGRWRFDLGVTGEDASLPLEPGDVISLPVRMFRGFTATAAAADGSPGFLWSVLGGDDPGHVTWAPRVFEIARDFGLVLLESGRLIDTKAGQKIPDGERPMPATTAADVARFQRVTPEVARRFVVRTPLSLLPGETLLIGPGAPLGEVSGFTLRRRVWRDGEETRVIASGPEVLFVHEGRLAVQWTQGELRLSAGDTMTVPIGVDCRFRSMGHTTAFVVRGTAARES